MLSINMQKNVYLQVNLVTFVITDCLDSLKTREENTQRDLSYQMQ